MTDADAPRFALAGNPNTGKTTLFNRLCGLRAHTANYPGVTVQPRVGTYRAKDATYSITDLPGIYALSLSLPEAELCRRLLAGELPGRPRPEALLIVADATNLARNLVLLGELLPFGLPAVVVLTMTDLARAEGLTIDTAALAARLGCPVVDINPRAGEHMEALEHAMAAPAHPRVPPMPADPAGRNAWAEKLLDGAVHTAPRPARAAVRFTDRVDRVVTHPVMGTGIFLLVMASLFTTIFWLAEYPMTWIELLFGTVGSWTERVLPAGVLRELLVGGVLNGIAGTVVFLPQICLLFFLLSLLEDTGYLARAAFVADRIMRRFGLPGQAFVPLLSSHACAIPGIMCAKLIPDRRDRIATILVAPFMSCSARLPVYVLLTSLLFTDQPLLAGAAFTGCYVLGAAAALLSAWIARRTVLPGAPRRMILELPSYKMPSLRTALLTVVDRGWTFLQKAGTVILAICVVMWWLSTYPVTPPPAEAVALRAQSEQLAATDADRAEALAAEADEIAARATLAGSFAGRLGHLVEPALEPLGYDWQISIGVLSSFLAREVFVSAMSVITGAGGDEESGRVLTAMRGATRSDGTPLFAPAAAASLLVFYVLAMQCLPTLAVTRRETGAWKWAALQLVYMSVVAYGAAFITYHAVRWVEV